MKILFIEDNVDFAEPAKEVFESLGKVCITPQNGWGCSRFHLMANMACSTVFSG
jgi:hypothetical protein